MSLLPTQKTPMDSINKSHTEVVAGVDWTRNAQGDLIPPVVV